MPARDFHLHLFLLHLRLKQLWQYPFIHHADNHHNIRLQIIVHTTDSYQLFRPRELYDCSSVLCKRGRKICIRFSLHLMPILRLLCWDMFLYSISDGSLNASKVYGCNNDWLRDSRSRGEFVKSCDSQDVAKRLS